MPSNYAEVETRIPQAIEHLRKNPDAHRAKIARQFDVPLQRLRFRLLGKPPASEVRGVHGRRLTPAQDLALITYVRKLISLGLHPRLENVKTAAFQLLRADDPSAAPLSHSWFKRWMNRHSEFKKSKRKPLQADRHNAEDPNVFRHYFKAFREAMREHGVQPCDTWNFDETGFRIGIAREDFVISLSERINERIRSKDPDNRESLTVVESINGVGGCIPPLMILTGACIMESWVMKNELDENIILCTAETGYSNDWLSLEWLKHFDQHSAKHQKGAWRLLLMDGYGSHHTFEFIRYCEKAKIIPFGLPPHTTHLLQPLDVVVFQPLKHWHAEAVKEAMELGDETFTKVEFLNAFNSFRSRAFKKSTIKSAWKEVGLFPFNPSIVFDKLPPNGGFEGYERPGSPEGAGSNPPPDPFWDFDYQAETPRGRGQLELSAYEMERSLESGSQFAKFVKGALAEVRAGELIERQLSRTQAAENYRKLRANQKRRFIQRGGVISVKNAWAMVT